MRFVGRLVIGGFGIFAAFFCGPATAADAELACSGIFRKVATTAPKQFLPDLKLSIFYSTSAVVITSSIFKLFDPGYLTEILDIDKTSIHFYSKRKQVGDPTLRFLAGHISRISGELLITIGNAETGTGIVATCVAGRQAF